MNRSFIVCSISLILVCAVSLAKSDIPSELDFVIFSSRAKNTGVDFPLTWTPSEKQIGQLESHIQNYLQSNPPSNNQNVEFSQYFRQYFGVAENGKKLILLNALCKNPIQNPEDKNFSRTHFIKVKGGGSCYFRVHYDPQTKIFSSLQYNSAQ